MARSVLVDTGFVVALLRRRDTHRMWAAAQAAQFPPPWHTCEAVLAEAFHMLELAGTAALRELLRRQEILASFRFLEDQGSVLSLMQKYANVPMSLADACLVRMTETHSNPVVLTTDSDFRVYRRHTRQIVPCIMPDRAAI